MSSLNLASFTPLNSDTKKKVITIWKSIFDSNDSFQFRNPVDWQAMGLLDYPKYVSKPMDLNTISRKLRDQKYRTVQNVLDDIQLIFDNCKVYNAPGSWIYNLADKLQKSFIKMIQNFMPKIVQNNIKSKINPHYTKIKQPQSVQQPMEEEAPFFIEQVCYHDKIKFTDKLTHINAENLETIVKKIFQKNPNAVKIIPPQIQPVIVPVQSQNDIKRQQNLPENAQNLPQENAPIGQSVENNLQQNNQQNNPEVILENKNQTKIVQAVNQKQVQTQQSKQRGRRTRTVKNTVNEKKETSKKSSQAKISLDKLQIGTKAQIFIDDLNYESFQDLMKMLEGMVEQKDKVMKKIKLD